MQPFILAPSILSANLARLGQEVETVLEAGADWIHFDVMDNHYVPNLTFGPVVCKALRDEGITAHIDVHLMVKPVDSLIEMFAMAGATSISFHVEATEHIDRSLQLILDNGCQAGLVFNPATPLDVLPYVLDKLSIILLMSVNPGFSGQNFIPTALQKINKGRDLIEKSGNQIRLQVDGGIHLNNLETLVKAGADTFVAGSAIFGNNKNAYENVKQFKQILNRL